MSGRTAVKAKPRLHQEQNVNWIHRTGKPVRLIWQSRDIPFGTALVYGTCSPPPSFPDGFSFSGQALESPLLFKTVFLYVGFGTKVNHAAFADFTLYKD